MYLITTIPEPPFLPFQYSSKLAGGLVGIFPELDPLFAFAPFPVLAVAFDTGFQVGPQYCPQLPPVDLATALPVIELVAPVPPVFAAGPVLPELGAVLPLPVAPPPDPPEVGPPG